MNDLLSRCANRGFLPLIEMLALTGESKPLVRRICRYSSPAVQDRGCGDDDLRWSKQIYFHVERWMDIFAAGRQPSLARDPSPLLAGSTTLAKSFIASSEILGQRRTTYDNSTHDHNSLLIVSSFQHRQDDWSTPPLPTSQPVRTSTSSVFASIEESAINPMQEVRDTANNSFRTDTTPARTRPASSRPPAANYDSYTSRRKAQRRNAVIVE